VSQTIVQTSNQKQIPYGNDRKKSDGAVSLSSMLLRSLKHRRARSLSALAALTVSAMVATALLTLYADLDAKLHHEFRSFGANVVATSPGSAITAADVQRAREVAGNDALVAPIAYAVAATDRGTPVVVAGVDFATMRKLDSWWKVDARPTGATDALLGQRAAGFVANEAAVTLTYAGKPLTLHGAGRLSTGGDEDSRIYIPMAAFTTWTGVQPSVLEIQVPGGEERVNAAITSLRQAMPALHIEPVRALVAGESRIVDRTHALMYGAMLLIALTVAVSVLATLSASVLERRRDFALMKALGASQAQLLGHFLLEALVIATVGVVLGYVLGSILAWAIGQWNFGTATLPRISLFPVVLLLNLAIATAAALFPARVLRGLQPAALLKGE
jgi:putative ABC transport system permease protein